MNTIKIIKLDGGNPVVYKFKTTYLCPPDCGTEEDDMGEYIPFCPTCDNDLSYKKYKFCPECGTKLYWGFYAPRVSEDKE